MNELVCKSAACMIDFSVIFPAQKQLLVIKHCIRPAATYANLKIKDKIKTTNNAMEMGRLKDVAPS